MLKLMQRLLAALGKTYRLDPDLPTSFLLGVVWTRSWWLLAGLLRCRRLVFVAPSASIARAGSIRFGRFATVEPHARIDGYAKVPVEIGARTKIGSYTIISCTSHMSTLGRGVKIGADCGLSEYCYIGAAGGVEIGDAVIVGQYVSFHSQNHVFADPARRIRDQGVTSAGIVIGNDVWIGAKVTILDGSRVGDGSVIAAGAVVNGVFPPGAVLAGVPARVIKSRIPEAAAAPPSE